MYGIIVVGASASRRVDQIKIDQLVSHRHPTTVDEPASRRQVNDRLRRRLRTNLRPVRPLNNRKRQIDQRTTMQRRVVRGSRATPNPTSSRSGCSECNRTAQSCRRVSASRKRLREASSAPRPSAEPPSPRITARARDGSLNELPQNERPNLQTIRRNLYVPLRLNQRRANLLNRQGLSSGRCSQGYAGNILDSIAQLPRRRKSAHPKPISTPLRPLAAVLTAIKLPCPPRKNMLTRPPITSLHVV